MGKPFIQFYENDKYAFYCKACNIHIAHTDNIVIRQIETIRGECIGFTSSLNCYFLKNPNWSTYTHHGDFDMYDDDSILRSNSSSCYLYCVSCNSFMGWKHTDSGEKHILFKSAIR